MNNQLLLQEEIFGDLEKLICRYPKKGPDPFLELAG